MLQLSIARKIAIAVALFLVPVAFILWLLAAGQGKDIRFADREVSGTIALRGLLVADTALDNAMLGGAPAGAAITASLEPAQAAFATLGLATDLAALLQQDGGDTGQVRTRLRALLASVGDRSNLILDNVLDSYYATDVVLNRMPDVLDNITDLRALAAGQAASPDAKAAFLVAQGGLDGVLSGMDGSMQSAIQDNISGTLAPALQAPYNALKNATALFTTALRGGKTTVHAEDFPDLLRQAAAFGDAGTISLQGLLQSRVAALRRARLIDFLITFMMFAGAAAATLWVISTGVVRRIDRLRNAMQTLAGDIDVAVIPYAGDHDEIGEMARTVRIFREHRIQRLNAEQTTRDLNAQRDKRTVAMDRHTADFAGAMAGTMAALTRSATEMSESAGSLLQAAASTGAEVDVTTQAAEDSSRNLSTVAAAVEQMTGSVEEIARRTTDAAQIARAAVARSQSADTAVRGLSDAAARIGAIAGAIEDIAGRTNLLALNATIEAARAGDAGRGFAVVAAEVKQLAGQTAQATKDIAAQIHHIGAATESAVAAMQDVSTSIRQVDEVAAAIAAAAEQQGATTREIAGNVGLVAGATAQTASSMRNVSDTTSQARTMSAVVAEAAHGLTRQSDELRIEVEQFLVAMRETTGFKRRYERYALTGVNVALKIGLRKMTCPLEDISIGGFRLGVALTEPPGTEVHIVLPGAQDEIAARIVSADGIGTGLFFDQAAGAQHIITEAIARLAPREEGQRMSAR